MSSKGDLGVSECDGRIVELSEQTGAGECPGMLPAADEEVVIEGKELFATFINEELEKKGLAERLTDADLAGGDSVANFPSYDDPLHNNNHFGSTGRALRSLADAFAKTPERRRVLIKANEVDLSSIKMEDFLKLLRNLFKGGITQERIVVLFFFCSDLGVRALQEMRAGKFFHNLMRWSLIFITEEVCKWVERHGGWAKVLNTSVNYAFKISIIVGALACTIAAAIYIRKNL